MMKLRSMRRLLMVSFGLLSSMMMTATSNRRFTTFNAANGLADNSAQTIYCMADGRLVVTTMGQINFFDGHKFTYVDPVEENSYPLADYAGNYHLYLDRHQRLWLKNTHTVSCVDLITERFVHSIEDEFSNMGVDNQVKDMFVGSEGAVWLVGDQGLYCEESRKIYPLRKGHNLQDLETYEERYLFLFYEDGLMETLDLQTTKLLQTSIPYDGKDAGRYGKTSVLLKDSCWIYQIRNGEKESIFMRYDILRKQWASLLKAPYHFNNMVKKDSLLYISSEYGYWVYDMKRGKGTHIERLQIANGHLLATDINVMAFDQQGGLWAGTEKRGLLYSRPFTSPFIAYSWDHRQSVDLYNLMATHMKPNATVFRGKTYNCVFRDSRGWTWVGTSNGLLLYRRSSDHLPSVITKNDGLLNNVIHAMVECPGHHIWVSTSYGISCIQIKDGKINDIISYNEYDDIPNESFINGAAACLPDGRVIMQGQDHMLVFNPLKMQTLVGGYSFEIYPRLTQLLVNGNNIRTGDMLGGNVILKKALTQTTEINLNYDQNSITLTFSAFNYFRPRYTYYRVRVKGLDDQWHVYASYNSKGIVDERGRFHLPLVSLKPGLYVIELQASMTPHQWDTKPYEWVIVVNEPWWHTKGMLTLLVSILLILLGVNAYYYLKNTNMRAVRNLGEQRMIERIKSYAERCCSHSGELLEPTPDEIYGLIPESANELAPEFIAVMLKIMPIVLTKEVSQMTMVELGDKAGMDIHEFYQLIMANIHKSSRPLSLHLMLTKGMELLETSQKSIKEIAEECRFVSPNYFTAAFFRQMKLTPEQYRWKNNVETRGVTP